VSRWYAGLQVTEAEIDTGSEPCVPSKMRRSASAAWRPIPSESVWDFYHQIASQPLRVWMHGGETMHLQESTP
jgi:hypothetical protein